jgi:hypothetical protein
MSCLSGIVGSSSESHEGGGRKIIGEVESTNKVDVSSRNLCDLLGRYTTRGGDPPAGSVGGAAGGSVQCKVNDKTCTALSCSGIYYNVSIDLWYLFMGL